MIKLIAAIAVPVISIFVFFLYLYISLPLYNTESPGLATRFDPELGWVTKNNLEIASDFEGQSYSTDGRGFRIIRNDKRRLGKLTTAPNKIKIKIKIICLGDSFTFGSGVSDYDTWCNGIQDAEISSINMGVPGYGVDQMLYFYRRISTHLAYSLMLVAFIDDDFLRIARTNLACHPRPTFRSEAGRVVRKPFRSDRISAVQFKACRVFQNFLAKIKESIPEIFLHEAALDRDSYDLGAAVIDNFKRESGERLAKLIMVRLPTLSGYRKSNKLSDQISDMVKDAKIDFIDLQQKMNDLEQSEISPLFLGTNRIDRHHPSVLGHRWIASQLSRVVNERGKVLFRSRHEAQLEN